jgi:hemerythrin-like domain-containing protein
MPMSVVGDVFGGERRSAMSEPATVSRRTAFAAAPAALLLFGCRGGDAEEAEVSATEDLMREHGVLRRLLVVFRETAAALQANAAVDAAALGRAARLFRSFGEDYHERRLEEQHVFPAVRKLGGEAAALVPVLLAQHEAGRRITGEVEAACAAGRIADPGRIAGALEAFARMYEAHAAFEDTVVFQAWKASLSGKALKAAGEQFEAIERAQFKGDGFELALVEVGAVERALGLADLGRYTAQG